MKNLLTFTVGNNDVTFTDEVKSDSESLVKIARLFYVGTHPKKLLAGMTMKQPEMMAHPPGKICQVTCRISRLVWRRSP